MYTHLGPVTCASCKYMSRCYTYSVHVYMCKHKYMNVKFCTIFQLLMYKTFTHRFMYNCMLFANCFFLLPLKLPGLGFVLFCFRLEKEPSFVLSMSAPHLLRVPTSNNDMRVDSLFLLLSKKMSRIVSMNKKGSLPPPKKFMVP